MMPSVPAGLSAEDFNRLRSYLPSSLSEALQADRGNPPERLVEQCQTHLSRVLTSTASHLPAYLVARVAQDPMPGRARGQFERGTLLFADISGFTAMSERLNRIGREGAEEITTVVNRYFSTMLTLMRESGGQLIKFGGDALLGLFLEPPEASTNRAVQAAVEMQAAMVDFAETKTSQGTFPLRMKVGLRRGQFFAAELGNLQGMEFALFGADVNATAAAESAATAGQVLVDNATARFLHGARTAPGPEGYTIVEGLAERITGVSMPEADLLAGIAAPRVENLLRLGVLLDALTPYLPAGLLPRLSSDTRGKTQIEGEHRLVSIVFTNVNGLGHTADQLGPGHETEITEILNAYFNAMGDAFRQFGGVINKIDLYDHGDKLLAFFGAPVAHEDDAERSVRAAWATRAALEKVNSALPSGVEPLSQRIGISYGYAFAGYMGTDWRHEYTVMGDEVNLAARLMSASAPSAITTSSNVLLKVQGLFDLAPRGSVMLKGKSQPFHLYTVETPKAVPEQVKRDGLRALLMGRDLEWQLLQGVVQQLFTGRGQIAGVIGEAGVGKTRLLEELQQLLKQKYPGAYRWAESRGQSFTESVAYVPVQDIVRQLLGVRPDDGDEVAVNKIRAALLEHLAPGGLLSVLPFVVNFLGLPLDDELRERVRYLEGEALQRGTFVALRRLFELSSGEVNQPLIIAIDDFQWLDQASLDFIDYLLPLVDRAPIMLFLMYRPERDKGFWKVRERAVREFTHCFVEFDLMALSTADSEALLKQLVPMQIWPEQVRSVVLARSEGNPLCIEEMLRIMIDKKWLTRDEAGAWQFTGTLDVVQVPDSLQGVLMTRLDTLDEPTRRTAQVAAVVGRNYEFDVLEAVTEEPRLELNRYINHLQQAEISQEFQRSPELIYTFRHGLMQEVYYESQLARTRRQYHHRIAEFLEEKHLRGLGAEGEADSATAMIAHHAFAAQDWARAVQYQTLAGQYAQRLFANTAAIDHFTKALQAAEAFSAEDTARQRQIAHAALGELYTTTGQFEAAFEHLEKARALAAQAQDTDAQARASRWFARAHEMRGEYDAALEWIGKGLATLGERQTAETVQMRIISGLIQIRQGRLDQALEECLASQKLAEQLNEVAGLARTYVLLGFINVQRGNSSTALEHFDQALSLYTRAGDLAGQATTHNQRANAYFNIGQWTAADAAYREAQKVFQQLGDRYNYAITDINLGELALNQGRLDEAVAFYRSALRAIEQIGGSPYLVGVCHNNLGATFIRRGDLPIGRGHLRQAQVSFEQAQSRDFLPELERHFAEAALVAGEWAEAETRGGQALALARELDMQNEVGIDLRVLGEIALAQNNPALATERLSESLKILNELGEVYQGARTRLTLAQLHTAQAQATEADVLLDQCEATFKQLGAELDWRHAQDLRAKF